VAISTPFITNTLAKVTREDPAVPQPVVLTTTVSAERPVTLTMDSVLCLTGLHAAQATSASNTAIFHIYRRRSLVRAQQIILVQPIKTELLCLSLAAMATSVTQDAAPKTELASLLAPQDQAAAHRSTDGATTTITKTSPPESFVKTVCQ